MNAERLQWVIEAVEKADPKEFDMFRWKCGTRGCAIGHACADDRVAEAGLRIGYTEGIMYEGRYLVGYVPIYNEFCSIGALAEFFGISKADVGDLFLPSRKYITKEQVLCKLRQYLADHTPVITTGELTKEELIPVASEKVMV